MNNIEKLLTDITVEALKELYAQEIKPDLVQLQKTKKEFEGDVTIVVFPFSKLSRKHPEVTAQEIGNYIKKSIDEVADFNAVQGFLNISLQADYWLKQLIKISKTERYGLAASASKDKLMMIEYSSPNTNKPLHLGHIRNNLLGYSISEIQKANGWNVLKTNIVNDRGIHICKSMLAWQKWGNGETPESSGIKGDHLVGKYYVEFDKYYKEEVKALINNGMSEEDAKRQAPLIKQAQQMLLLWEQNDPEVRKLWQKMNGWVYEGFEQTYKKLGVNFDKIYYESDTYTEGKEKVEEGLENGVFYRKPDRSVWADLSDEGLDEKLLLRADGTSVYITQDIGTAKLRYDDYPIDKMVYVVGNEQNYHFQVLSILLDKLGFEWGKELVHFSYGMVELPEGKMKSREGTVVDADDLVEDMVKTARETSEELGKLDDFTQNEADNVYKMVGLGALKYFILKVDPKKNMLFNPKESIDFNGNTGPFIQYTHARIKSVLRKATEQKIDYTCFDKQNTPLSDKERHLIILLSEFPNAIRQAGEEFSPALVANYCYELAKEFNQFYHDFSILKEENSNIKKFRLLLSEIIANTIKTGMKLLGIEMPERM